MSTRSHVGIKEGNNYKHIYVHFDGYPTGVGRILKTYYTDPAKVKELISLGDCSVLGCELYPAKEHFDDPTYSDPNGSLFYGRDRGEKNVDARTTDWDEYVKQQSEDVWIEYVYVYENGEWTGYRKSFRFDKDFTKEPEWEGLEKIEEKEYEDA